MARSNDKTTYLRLPSATKAVAKRTGRHVARVRLGARATILLLVVDLPDRSKPDALRFNVETFSDYEIRSISPEPTVEQHFQIKAAVLAYEAEQLSRVARGL